MKAQERFGKQYHDFRVNGLRYQTSLTAITKVDREPGCLPKFSSVNAYTDWLKSINVTEEEKLMRREEPEMRGVQKSFLFHKFIKRLVIPHINSKSVLCAHICTKCNTLISLSRNSKTGTFKASNGFSHIKNRHANEEGEISVETQDIMTKVAAPSFFKRVNDTQDSQVMKSIIDELVFLFMKNHLPMKVFEDPALLEILKLATKLKSEPSLPSRAEFALRRDKMSQAFLWQIREYVGTCRDYYTANLEKPTTRRFLALSHDGWPGANHHKGCGISIRFCDPISLEIQNLSLGLLQLPIDTPNAVAEYITDFLTQYDIHTDDIVACMSDNAPTARCTSEYLCKTASTGCVAHLADLMMTQSLSLKNSKKGSRNAKVYDVVKFMRKQIELITKSHANLVSYKERSAALSPTLLKDYSENEASTIHTMAESILVNFHCIKQFHGDSINWGLDQFGLIAEFEALLNHIAVFSSDVQQDNLPLCGFAIYLKAKLRSNVRSEIRSTVLLTSDSVWKGSVKFEALPRQEVFFGMKNTTGKKFDAHAHETSKELYERLNHNFNEYFVDKGCEGIRKICREVLMEDDSKIDARFARHFASPKHEVLICTVPELLAMVLDPLLKCIFGINGRLKKEVVGDDFYFLWEIAMDILALEFSKEVADAANMKAGCSPNSSVEGDGDKESNSPSSIGDEYDSDFEGSAHEKGKNAIEPEPLKNELQLWKELIISRESWLDIYPQFDIKGFALKKKPWTKLNSLKFFADTSVRLKFPIIHRLALRYVPVGISNTSREWIFSKTRQPNRARRNRLTVANFHTELILKSNTEAIRKPLSTPADIDTALRKIQSIADRKKQINSQTMHDMCCPMYKHSDKEPNIDDEDPDADVDEESSNAEMYEDEFSILFLKDTLDNCCNDNDVEPQGSKRQKYD